MQRTVHIYNPMTFPLILLKYLVFTSGYIHALTKDEVCSKQHSLLNISFITTVTFAQILMVAWGRMIHKENDEVCKSLINEQ